LPHELETRALVACSPEAECVCALLAFVDNGTCRMPCRRNRVTPEAGVEEPLLALNTSPNYALCN